MQETRTLFPVGCKFQPSDKQLVEYYLFNKIYGNPDPFHYCFVNEEDLYGIKEPWMIWKEFGGANLEGVDLYFFTHLKKKSANGLRIDRKVGSGVWQGEDGGKVIRSSNSKKKIGLKKRYRYENKGSPYNGCWIMHEYTLNAKLLPQNLQSSDYALCRIRKNGEPEQVGKTKSRKKRKLDEQDEDILLPEPVLVENHQYQYVQENQPQPFTEETTHDQLDQPFQNHQLMQQTPCYFFRAKEETHQPSVTEQNPQDLQLSKYHQNMQLIPVTDQNSYEQVQLSEYHQAMQHTPVTDQNSHEQLQLSEYHQNMQLTPVTAQNSHELLQLSEYHQAMQLTPVTDQNSYEQLQLSEYHQAMHHTPVTDQNSHEQLQLPVENQLLYTSSDIQEYQQMRATDQSPHHQLELSVEDYESTIHDPFIVVEVTQAITHDQLECSVENDKYMVHNPSNFEDNQQLPSTEQSLYDWLDQSVEIHQSTLHNPSKFKENQQQPATEHCLYDQLDKSVDNHQHMLQTPSDIKGYQRLPGFHDTLKWLPESF